MSLFTSYVSPTLGLLGVLTYLFSLHRWLSYTELNIVNYSSKQSKALDKKFLDNKTLKTHDFRQFHKAIHNLEREIDNAINDVFFAKWLGIASIVILLFDLIANGINHFILFYDSNMESLVRLFFIGIFLLFLITLVRTIRYNKYILKTLKKKGNFLQTVFKFDLKEKKNG